jgi:hypothetical protein
VKARKQQGEKKMPRNATATATPEAPIVVEQPAPTRIAMSRTCNCCQRSFNARVLRSDINDLCEACYDEAGFENAHNDGHHDTNADEGCHVCSATDPHASYRSRPASGQQGKVLTTTDGRLGVNAPVLPEGAERVKLTGTRLGRPAAKYNGEASVIVRDNHVWGGHSSWVLVIPDGMTQRRWFWSEDVEAIAAPRARRARRAPAQVAA